MWWKSGSGGGEEQLFKNKSQTLAVLRCSRSDAGTMNSFAWHIFYSPTNAYTGFHRRSDGGGRPRWWDEGGKCNLYSAPQLPPPLCIAPFVVHIHQHLHPSWLRKIKSFGLPTTLIIWRKQKETQNGIEPLPRRDCISANGSNCGVFTFMIVEPKMRREGIFDCQNLKGKYFKKRLCLIFSENPIEVELGEITLGEPILW